MSEPLKPSPCPFCGCEAYIRFEEGYWLVGCNAGQTRLDVDTLCRTNALGFAHVTRKGAIAAWNRRAPAPSGVRERDLLDEAELEAVENELRFVVVDPKARRDLAYDCVRAARTALAAPSPDTLAADYANACKEIEGLERNVRELRASLGAPAGLRELLVEILTTAIRLPNERYAYSRCNVCEMPWWDEKEQHQRDCWVPRLRAALASAPGAGAPK